MNGIAEKNGITYGLISGIASILITTLIYTFNINLFMSGWITFLKISVFTSIATLLLINTKKQFNNDFSFKTAFKTYFIHTIIGLLLATLFEIVLFNIIDPSLKDSLKEMAMKFTAEFMEKLSLPASEINKALAEIEKTDQYSFFQLIKGSAVYILFSSLFGLILAAIFKSKNTNQGF